MYIRFAFLMFLIFLLFLKNVFIFQYFINTLFNPIGLRFLFTAALALLSHDSRGRFTAEHWLRGEQNMLIFFIKQQRCESNDIYIKFKRITFMRELSV